MVSLGRRFWGLSPRPNQAPEQAFSPRPFGPLVWLHLPAKAAAGSMLELARRLIEDDGVAVIITTVTPITDEPDLLIMAPPADQPSAIERFLAHWTPDAIVAFDGEVWPAMIQSAHHANIPVLLADARTPRLIPGRESWFLNQMRHTLAQVNYIGAMDEPAARAYRKAGAPSECVKVTGRMEERSATLPYLEAERESLATQLHTRPLWFAACIPQAEETAILEAHQSALAYNHRLLLIVLPESPQNSAALTSRLTAENWVFAERSQEQEPEEDDTIYVVTDIAELGLWYRLAPITFLGGSLSGTGALRSPLEPAALGSAVLHGPRPGPHGVALGRLGAARGARAVASARDLSESLADLMSPEKVARLAQAAWDISSEGAEVTEDMMNRLRNILDGVA